MIESMMIHEDLALAYRHIEGSKFILTLSDTQTGERVELGITDTVLAAILYLAIKNDDSGACIIERGMYSIVEPVIQYLPNNLRPIP